MSHRVYTQGVILFICGAMMDMKISAVSDADQAELVDPVCGMRVTENSQHHHKYHGVDYYFCSAGCQQKFEQHPEQYLQPASETPPEGDENAIYTCPMHPEVEQRGPGTCPKCGMALEAKTATMTEDNTELLDMSRRFWISAALVLLGQVLELRARSRTNVAIKMLLGLASKSATRVRDDGDEFQFGIGDCEFLAIAHRSPWFWSNVWRETKTRCLMVVGDPAVGEPAE